MSKQNDRPKSQQVQVGVRCRPINSIEMNQGSYTVVNCNAEKHEVFIKGKQGKTFTFDHVFHSTSKQVDIYNAMVMPVIEEVLMGYNCTIFAYGQTGTGKTFTMEGQQTDDPSMSLEDDPLCGLIPRSMHQILEQLKSQEVEFSVRASFLELYNEELFDLLGSNDAPLPIYEDATKKGSVIISRLKEVQLQNKQEVFNIMRRGARHRHTACTLKNANSSRSHSVFSVTIHTKENMVDGEELLKCGKLHLVDLAGSENIGRSWTVDKGAKKSCNMINQSLLTLGRVITALAEHRPHVPFRESKLTRLLQDSLGGRTKTSIIATISPASVNLQETLSTLNYASSAKKITNRPEMNQTFPNKTIHQKFEEMKIRLLHDQKIAAIQDKISQQKKTKDQAAVTELVNKLSGMLSDTKQELGDMHKIFTIAQGNVDNCATVMAQLQSMVQEMEKDRDQHASLLSEHAKTETQLIPEVSEQPAKVEQIVYEDTATANEFMPDERLRSMLLEAPAEDSPSPASKKHDRARRTRSCVTHSSTRSGLAPSDTASYTDFAEKLFSVHNIAPPRGLGGIIYPMLPSMS